MARIATAAKAKGAALLVDATHDVGIRHIDVKTLDPDFLIFPTWGDLLSTLAFARPPPTAS